MAFIRASQGGGSELSRVKLWENANPTSNFPSSGSTATATLSQGMSNFEYLEFVYAYNVSTTSTEYSMIVPVSDVQKTAIAASKVQITMCVSNATPSYFARRIGYTSNTQITIGGALQVGGSTISNGYAMPLRINGVNIG